MSLRAWKLVGVICSGIWLFVSGCFAGLIILFSMAAPPPNSEYWSFNTYVHMALKDIAPGYILFGVGPVIGLGIWMKKMGDPLGRAQLIGLAICAIIPFLYFLLIVYWA